MATREWMPNRKPKRETLSITVTSGVGSANTDSTNFDNELIQIMCSRNSGAVDDSFKLKVTETSTGYMLQETVTSTDGFVLIKPGGYLLGQLTFAITAATDDGTYTAVIDYK